MHFSFSRKRRAAAMLVDNGTQEMLLDEYRIPEPEFDLNEVNRLLIPGGLPRVLSSERTPADLNSTRSISHGVTGPETHATPKFQASSKTQATPEPRRASKPQAALSDPHAIAERRVLSEPQAASASQTTSKPQANQEPQTDSEPQATIMPPESPEPQAIAPSQKSAAALGKMREQEVPSDEGAASDGTSDKTAAIYSKYPKSVADILARKDTVVDDHVKETRDPGPSQWKRREGRIASSRSIHALQNLSQNDTGPIEACTKLGIRLPKHGKHGNTHHEFRNEPAHDAKISSGLNVLDDLFTREPSRPKPKELLSPRTVSPEHQMPGEWDLRGCINKVSVWYEELRRLRLEIKNGVKRYYRRALFFCRLDHKCGMRGTRRLLRILQVILGLVETLKQTLDVAGSALFDRIEEVDEMTKASFEQLRAVRDILLGRNDPACEGPLRGRRGFQRSQTRELLEPQIEQLAINFGEAQSQFAEIVKEAKRQCIRNEIEKEFTFRDLLRRYRTHNIDAGTVLQSQ